jgi:hypothetical protein
MSCVVCVLFALATASATVCAATLTVTNIADSGVGTLRAALASANNGDTINFALPTPAKITLAGLQLSVGKSISVIGPGPSNLAVDGNGRRVFEVDAPNTVLISGLTITNGIASVDSGGGILNSATLTVSNCFITGNSAADGGGIFNGGNLTVVGCTISGNSAPGDGGGGIEQQAGNGNAALTILNSTITSNSAPFGGGIYNWPAGSTNTVTIVNSSISANMANFGGGGIYNYCSGGDSANLQIINSRISGNSVSNGGYGGGIAFTAEFSGIATLTLVDSTISSNSASDGGGIWNTGQGFRIVSITNSTLNGNSAVTGGAIANDGFFIRVVNSTISSNFADLHGGAIVNADGANLLLLNTTLNGDRVGTPQGGGIYNVSGYVQIGGTILNEANGGNIFNDLGTITSLGYNLLNDSSLLLSTPKPTDQQNTLPLLGPLQDNGGPTFTHAPLPGSPAIDKGTNFSASATDQRGWPRTFDKAAIANAAGGDGTDIGAVESRSYTVVNTNDSGTGSLRQAIADSNAQPGTNTIDFAPSAYGTILLTSGELLVTNNVFIAGPGATHEAVDGNAASRVFHFTNTIATIAGLTITNGYVPDNGEPGGAGIYNKYSTLTVSNCVLTGNRSDYVGGAIYNDGYRTNGAHLLIVGSTVNGNYAENYAAGVNNSFGSLQISNSSVSSNTVNNGYGGGIVNGGGALLIDHSSLNNNFGHYGGGIANFSGLSNTEATVISSTMMGNTAGSGGAIFNGIVGSVPTRDAIVSITNCVLANNDAANGGGAIFNTGLSSSSASITTRIVNSTLSGNTAHSPNALGGAILTGSTDPTFPGNYSVLVLNSTLCRNSADNGGAIHVSDSLSSVQLGGVILNQGASGVNLWPGARKVTSLGYNLCSDNGTGYLTNVTDQINTEPLLGPLQDNGGPTFTHAPLPGSPAIDKGTNFSGSATDQRGFSRTVNIAGIPNAAAGDSTDIGAVEQDAGLRLVNSGVVLNQFGFSLTGPFTNVVVEATTNVAGSNWTALSTNVLGDSALRFNDPAAPTLPKRFYRARAQ